MSKLIQNLERMTRKDIISVYHRLADGRRQKVAEVFVDKNKNISEQLEYAYMQTNSIEDGWWNNNDVKKYFTSEFCRSTNIGDTLEIGGEYYVCDIVGFKKNK
tara:strand:- start:170 stop:478 length:309 start_codon:yes stop_codon:yes gene_type:complete